MANFTQNISGVINCFGIQPSTKWGSAMTFGVATWGNGASGAFGMPLQVISYHNDTGPTFADTYSNNLILAPYANVASFVQSAILESLRDGSGRYYYNLPGGVTNDENAFVPSYTAQVNPSSLWILSSTSNVSWVNQ